MLSDVERLMYIKEAMYISQSQQIQHCWYGLLLMPQVTTTIPSLCVGNAADHRPACPCDTWRPIGECCVGACPCVAGLGVVCRPHHRGTTVYISTIKLDSGTCRLDAALCIPCIMVMYITIYITEFRYMSGTTQSTLNTLQGSNPVTIYHHITVVKKSTVLECSHLDLYMYLKFG